MRFAAASLALLFLQLAQALYTNRSTPLPDVVDHQSPITKSSTVQIKNTSTSANYGPMVLSSNAEASSVVSSNRAQLAYSSTNSTVKVNTTYSDQTSSQGTAKPTLDPYRPTHAPGSNISYSRPNITTNDSSSRKSKSMPMPTFMSNSSRPFSNASSSTMQPSSNNSILLDYDTIVYGIAQAPYTTLDDGMPRAHGTWDMKSTSLRKRPVGAGPRTASTSSTSVFSDGDCELTAYKLAVMYWPKETDVADLKDESNQRRKRDAHGQEPQRRSHPDIDSGHLNGNSDGLPHGSQQANPRPTGQQSHHEWDQGGLPHGSEGNRPHNGAPKNPHGGIPKSSQPRNQENPPQVTQTNAQPQNQVASDGSAQPVEVVAACGGERIVASGSLLPEVTQINTDSSDLCDQSQSPAFHGISQPFPHSVQASPTSSGSFSPLKSGQIPPTITPAPSVRVVNATFGNKTNIATFDGTLFVTSPSVLLSIPFLAASMRKFDAVKNSKYVLAFGKYDM